MIYGLIIFLKSLFFRGFFISLVFIGLLSLFNTDIEKSIKEHIELLYILLGVLFIERAIYFIRYWKYIILPYSLNLHGVFKEDTNKRDLFLDRFIRFKKITQKSIIDNIRCKDLDNFTLEYKNFISIDIEKYRQGSEYILHFLKLIDKRYELKIYHSKDRSVILSFYKLPTQYEIDYSYFKKDKIFLGMYEKGLYYRPIDTLDHLLCVGESGSGKSNFMQLLNINFLFNLHRFNKIYMVDLKGGVELKRFNHISNIKFVSDIEKLDLLLDNVLEDLKATQEYMLEHNIRKLATFTLLVFDEIGAVSVYPDKRIRENIFNKLSLIAMQGRSSGILLLLFGQKIDNTILPSTIVNNLQTRVLLKTSNDYNINIIDLKDNIRKTISWVEVQDFSKGRAIIKDGLTSDKYLVQFPYISDSFLDSTLKLNFSSISACLKP